MEERIQKIVEKITAHLGEVFLVEVVVKGLRDNKKIKVLLDCDSGLTIDHCSMVSREMGKILEEDDFIESKYTLEVSSPGVGYPLKMIRQYKKNIGREVEIICNENDEIFLGKIDAVLGDEKIVIKNKKDRELIFDISEIKKSKIIISI